MSKAKKYDQNEASKFWVLKNRLERVNGKIGQKLENLGKTCKT